MDGRFGVIPAGSWPGRSATPEPGRVLGRVLGWLPADGRVDEGNWLALLPREKSRSAPPDGRVAGKLETRPPDEPEDGSWLGRLTFPTLPEPRGGEEGSWLGRLTLPVPPLGLLPLDGRLTSRDPDDGRLTLPLLGREELPPLGRE